MKILYFFSQSVISVPILLYIAFLAITIPYGFPLFGIATFLFFVVKLLTKSLKFKINIGIILLFLCISFYIIGVASSHEIYGPVLEDLTDILSYLIIWVLISDLKKEEYPILINNFANLMVINGFIFSLFSLYKFISLINGVHWEWLYVNDLYPSGSSLVVDYNMFSLSMFASVLMALYKLTVTTNYKLNIFYIVTALFCLISISLAGSRRGWIILFIFLVTFTLFFFYWIFKNKRNFKKFFLSIIILTPITILTFLINKALNFNVIDYASEEFQRMSMRFETIRLSSLDMGFSNRSSRWEYALELIRSSDFYTILLGDGFDYLMHYSEQFSTTLGSDYPHNPILSSLLYAGLIGTIPLFIMLIHSLIKAFRVENKNLIMFSLLFIIAFIFVFISANSIFSIKPFFVMLLIVLSFPVFKKQQNRDRHNKTTESF